MIQPVILAGGSGTRLWPLSRRLHPKQLLDLVDEHTLLQHTVLRLAPGMESPMVICNADHRFMVVEQLRDIQAPPSTVVLEPVGRNTAPAVAVAALIAMADGRDPILLILPADHHMAQVDRFHAAVAAGETLTAAGHLVTFGIVPTGPETGYGYIRKGAAIALPDMAAEATAIDRFVEKPDLTTARAYLRSGDYCWNSGMFMFRASRVLTELDRFAPKMVTACRRAVNDGHKDLGFFRLSEPAFTQSPSDSLDYAVMEKTDAGAMIMLDAGWDDLGSWEALWQIGDKDGRANRIKGDVLIEDVHASYLHSTGRLVAAVGLENHVVVETADAVMISPRDRVQDVKTLVTALMAADREEATRHPTVHRPYGWVKRLVRDEAYQVNQVTIHPGAGLALQRHTHRAEHWVVVAGQARVTRGDDRFVLDTNASTHVPPGVPHRLANPGPEPLVVIEIQTGAILDEADVERLDTLY